MTEEEALAAAKVAASMNQFLESHHSSKEPYQMGMARGEWRDASRGDIREALSTATKAEDQGDGKWRYSGGTDLDEDELIVVFMPQPPGRVITIF